MSQDHDHDAHDHTHEHDPRSFPDESLPEGAVVDGIALGKNVDESFDYVVVGSGAGGAVAAHTLATAGFSVALVEEGPWVKTREFGEKVYDAFRRMYRDAGTQVIEGRSYIPLIQGRCVGGSTVINSAIAHRTPDDVLAQWEGFGLGADINSAALEPHFDALERELNVHAVNDDVLGNNNRLFLDEAKSAGLTARKMPPLRARVPGLGPMRAGLPQRRQAGNEHQLRAVGARPRSAHLLLVPGRPGSRRGWPGHGCARADGVRRSGGSRAARGPPPRPARRARGGQHHPDAEHPAPQRSSQPVAGRALPVSPRLRSGRRVRLSGAEMSFGATQGAEVHAAAQDRGHQARDDLHAAGARGGAHPRHRPGADEELRRLRQPRGVGGRHPRRGRGHGQAGLGRPRQGEAEPDQGRHRADPQGHRHARAHDVRGGRYREVWPGIFGLPGIITSIDQVGCGSSRRRRSSRAFFSFITTHMFRGGAHGGRARQRASSGRASRRTRSAGSTSSTFVRLPGPTSESTSGSTRSWA